MTEIKPPYDELDTIINEYVDNYELTGDEGSYTPTLTEKLLIKDAIHGLLADTDWDNAWGRYIAALAKSQPVEQGKPVTPFCMHWVDRWGCNHYVDQKEPHPANATPLFTHPVRPMSDEQIAQWMPVGLLRTEEFVYQKGIKDAEKFHGIKGATE